MHKVWELSLRSYLIGGGGMDQTNPEDILCMWILFLPAPIKTLIRCLIARPQIFVCIYLLDPAFKLKI